MKKQDLLLVLRRLKVHHFVFWISIISFNIYIHFDPSYPWWVEVIDASFLVLNGFAAFYFTYFYIAPRLLGQRKYGRFVVIILVMALQMTILYLIFSNLKTYIFKPEVFINRLTWQNKTIHFLAIYWTYFIPLVLSTSLRIMNDRFSTAKKYAIIKEEKLRSELNFLRDQLNPHFLFNVMNTIHFIISKENQKARDLVLSISELLRYQLYESKEDFVPIEKEIKYIENYLISRIDYKKENDQTSLEVGSNVRKFKTTPLIFKPLLDKIFDMNNQTADGIIGINIQNTPQSTLTATFTLQNYAPSIGADTNERGLEGPQIGDLRKRLDMLYPNQYILQSQHIQNIYNIKLSLYYGKNKLFDH